MSSSDPSQIYLPQLSNTLPTLTRHVTGYDPKESGKSVLLSSNTGRWQHWATQNAANNRAHNVVWTNTFPVNMNRNADLAEHEALLDSGRLGLIKPKGVVVRVVDFAPGYPGRMHISKSIDVGIVMNGTVEMILDSGDTTVLRNGDVVIQRATMHQWRNVGEGWARMLFVLQDADDIIVNGQNISEALAPADPKIPPSNN
jgi:quercetin dioxygenase-like cupin family protein